MKWLPTAGWRVQAKDLSDGDLMAAFHSCCGRHGVPRWATLWDIQDALKARFPTKVTLAKLRSAVKRGILDGCTCGCRGDFELPAGQA